MPKIIYIACPYSDPDPNVRRRRFAEVNLLAARLIREGEVVYSPISHSHPITETGLANDWSFWQRQDLAMLKVCSSLLVYCLPGWDLSTGVRAEIDAANKADMPVVFHMPEMEALIGRRSAGLAP